MPNVTAIQDRLTIGLHQAKRVLGISLAGESFVVAVNTDPPVDTTFSVYINATKVTFAGGASPTIESVAAGLVAEINAALSAVVTATDNLDGTYDVDTFVPAQTFTIYPDGFQELESASIEDEELAAEIAVAKVLADNYTNNPFTLVEVDDISGEITTTDLVIPDPVRRGVLQLLAHLHSAGVTSAVAAVGPVKRRKVGGVEVEYATGTDTSGGTASDDIPAMVRSILSTYRLLPGL